MKNFIRFLDAEFHTDFEKKNFIKFCKVFDNKINNYITVDQNS